MPKDFHSDDTAGKPALWRIEFTEKPLEIGIIDNLMYQGRDSSHSFLRLIDAYGEVRGELHGFSYNPDDQSKADANFNPWKRIKHAFSQSSDPYNPNMVKVFHFDFHRTHHPKLTGQPVFSGTKDKMIAYWMRAINRGVEINKIEHEYRPFSLFNIWRAQNCHTATIDMIEAMDSDVYIEPVYATPGLEHR